MKLEFTTGSTYEVCTDDKCLMVSDSNMSRSFWLSPELVRWIQSTVEVTPHGVVINNPTNDKQSEKLA